MDQNNDAEHDRYGNERGEQAVHERQFFLLAISWRARRRASESASRTSSMLCSVRLGIFSSTISITAAMAVNFSLPSRSAPTPSPPGALGAHGAAPPVFAASLASRRHGNF